MSVRDLEDDDDNAFDEFEGGDDTEDPSAQPEATDGEEDYADGGSVDSDDQDDDRDSLQARRREERRRKREMRRDRENQKDALIQSQRRQIEELAQRMGSYEQRGLSQDLQSLDQQINNASSHIQNAQQAMRDALSLGDSEAHVRATEYYYEARRQHEVLAGSKQTYINQARQQTQQPRPVDPAVIHHGTQFLKDHSWYNGNSTQEDSLVVKALDSAVRAEGFDPRTPEYWKELRKRVKSRLAHRFDSSGNSDVDGDYSGFRERRSVASSARSSGPPRTSSGRVSVDAERRTLSKEEVSIYKEAGIWDDPARLKKVLAERARVRQRNATQR